MKSLPSAQPGAETVFARRFATQLSLTPDELPIIRDICASSRPVRRRQDIVIEGKRNRNIFFVLEGIFVRYRIMRDGQRQIVSILLPGDMAGARSCFFETALYSIRSLTNGLVATLPLDGLFGLLDRQPQLAGKIFCAFVHDAAICAEHVVVVGRRSARERIAHFLLELLTRLRAIGLADDHSYRIPFSQDIICDALGLSLAYVNRELRRLTQDGLLEISDHKVVIKDIEALSELADFERRYLQPMPLGEVMAPSFLRRPAPGQGEVAFIR
jgi:CRP-like cAMP-binding protein